MALATHNTLCANGGVLEGNFINGELGDETVTSYNSKWQHNGS